MVVISNFRMDWNKIQILPSTINQSVAEKKVYFENTDFYSNYSDFFPCIFRDAKLYFKLVMDVIKTAKSVLFIFFILKSLSFMSSFRKVLLHGKSASKWGGGQAHYILAADLIKESPPQTLLICVHLWRRTVDKNTCIFVFWVKLKYNVTKSNTSPCLSESHLAFCFCIIGIIASTLKRWYQVNRR